MLLIRSSLACFLLTITIMCNHQVTGDAFASSNSTLSGTFNETASLTNQDLLEWNKYDVAINATANHLEQIATQAGYAMLLLFFILSVGVSLGIGMNYLTSRPSFDPDDPEVQEPSGESTPTHSATLRSAKEANRKLIKKQSTRAENRYEYWTKEQNLSGILAGFTISGLVFILAIEKSSVLQATIEFFLIAFILEMLAFLCYRIQTHMGYEYFATLMQFGGAIALINGFLVFIVEKSIGANTTIPWTIVAVFTVGYIGYLLFIILNLMAYVNEMRRYN